MVASLPTSALSTHVRRGEENASIEVAVPIGLALANHACRLATEDHWQPSVAQSGIVLNHNIWYAQTLCLLLCYAQMSMYS